MAESRKTVTIVFTDVTGSTALGERLDPEAMRRVMERYFSEMRAVLERHGGTVEKFIGDAVMAVFGIPTVHEDDALRGVRAASEMRERLAVVNEELERERRVTIAVRTGVNTGEVVAGDPGRGQAFATGDAVNVAARLEQAAQPSEILLGPLTYRLVREAVRAQAMQALEVRGKSEAIQAWCLLEVLPDTPAFTKGIDMPFVGRGRELGALRTAYERARDGGRPELVTVTGPPGIGKSRLVRELLAEVAGDARVVVGRCLPYGEGITYWPLAEIMRQVAGSVPRAGLTDLLADAPDGALAVERLLAAIGATDEAARTEEIFWATRLLVERLAGERPLIVVIDDTHWAEPTLLDLIEYLAGFARIPALVACTARPELFEARPDWPRAGAIELEPLDDTDAETLIDALLADAEVSASVRERIHQRAEGNPLFVEQMLALAAENGDDKAVVPPTIQALLAARLDHLPADERAVLVRGAVEGRLFHRGAVSALLPEEERDGVPGRLLTLARKNLIRPDQSLFPEDDAFRFAHGLVRDAAYEAAPKQLRAELHERFAAWLEEQAGERLSEVEEILGYHLEQSHRCRQSLGEPPGDLGRRGGTHLAAAGNRALDRGDVPAAANLLRRALDLLPEDDPARVEVALDLAEALTTSGHAVEAAAVLALAAEHARMLASERLQILISLRSKALEVELNSEADLDDILTFAEGVIHRCATSGDHAVLAAAWHAVHFVEWFRGRLAASRAAAEQALAHAERLGNARLEAELHDYINAAGYFGDQSVEALVPQLQEFVAWAKAHGALLHEALALDALGILAFERDPEAGRELRAQAWQILDELGMPVVKAIHQGASGFLPGECGFEPEALVARLRDSYEVLESAGDKAILSTVAFNLALALYELGEYDEAERLSFESERAGSAEDVVTQIGWRAVRAMVRARSGELEEAAMLARDAVERALRTEYLLSTADAYLSLGEVLRLAGRAGEARQSIERALRIYEQKGLALSADVVRRKLQALQWPAGSPS